MQWTIENMWVFHIRLDGTPFSNSYQMEYCRVEYERPTYFQLSIAYVNRWPSGQPWLWRTTEIIVIHRLTDSESDESSSSPSSWTDKSPSNVFSILTWQRFRFSSQVARMFSFPSKESVCHVADACN